MFSLVPSSAAVLRTTVASFPQAEIKKKNANNVRAGGIDSG